MRVSKRAEIDLLLSCVRIRLEPDTSGRIRSLVQKEIDWDCLVQAAIRHRVMPLLYRSLKNTCPEAVPNAYLEQLRDSFLANAARNVFLTNKLFEILSLLKANNILALPFKGPVLAESVFGNLSLRQFVDLDVLVYKRDALRARDLLMSKGYRPVVDWGTSICKSVTFFRQAG